MATELKVEQGLVIRPTLTQLNELIRKPLTTRRHHKNLSISTIADRSGLSPSAIKKFCGQYGGKGEHGVYISTIARVMDALDYPVTAHNFNVILSIGGSLLDEAVINAQKQLNPWRDSAAVEHEAVAPVRNVADRQAELNAAAAHAAEAAPEPEPILQTPPERTVALEELVTAPTVLEISASALDAIAPATLKQYAACGIQVRIVA